MSVGIRETDWDSVPDEELEETFLERIEGLKEMFPEKLRKKASTTVDWSWWMIKGTFSLTRSAVWIVTTSSLIMIMPYLVEKEISDMEKMQIKSQQQLLLGPSAAMMEKKQ